MNRLSLLRVSGVCGRPSVDSRDQLDHTVFNAGFSGDRARDLLKRPDMEVIACKPTAVLLLVGGKDHFDGLLRYRLLTTGGAGPMAHGLTVTLTLAEAWLPARSRI